MPERKISYEIKEHLGVINSNSNSGWNKELNLVSWNGNDAKYDIREWDEYHEKMNKGITLSLWEMQKVVDLYLKNNTDKAVAKGRAIEEERRMRMELTRKPSQSQAAQAMTVTMVPVKELQEEPDEEEIVSVSFDEIQGDEFQLGAESESEHDQGTPF